MGHHWGEGVNGIYLIDEGSFHIISIISIIMMQLLLVKQMDTAYLDVPIPILMQQTSHAS